nr:immunoglobulin light chain junction region [Macaca mulatta]
DYYCMIWYNNAWVF